MEEQFLDLSKPEVDRSKSHLLDSRSDAHWNFYCVIVFILFLVAVVKTPDKSALREKRVIWLTIPL